MPQGAATEALQRIGLTPEAFMRIVHRVANDYKRGNASWLGDRDDDFRSFLTEQGLKAAIRYDPSKANGDQGVSFIWKIMERRCDDFYRLKSEGFGDSRYGNDGRIHLTDQEDDFDTDLDFDELLGKRRAAKWHKAAQQVALPVTEWVVQTLDLAADKQAA